MTTMVSLIGCVDLLEVGATAVASRVFEFGLLVSTNLAIWEVWGPGAIQVP